MLPRAKTKSKLCAAEDCRDNKHLIQASQTSFIESHASFYFQSTPDYICIICLFYWGTFLECCSLITHLAYI